MSLSQEILPQLPYLRRFARALTGTQKSGDAYVGAFLESMVADPSIYSPDLEPRVSLYRGFLRVWRTVGLNRTPAMTTPNSPFAAAARNLDALAPMPREAFLLTAVEAFTIDQTARILDTDAVRVTQLINQAGREIADQVATDVLIIEDEPLIAMDLAGLAEELGHRVVGRARSHKEAIRAVKSRAPGLVLADIQLADGSSGLEAVNEILQSTSVPVIFITAYPERLLTGDRPEPTFLITKPFAAEMVKAVISQALFFDTRPRQQPETLASA